MAHSTVLFLCTANYFRSRFAELLFAHRAAQTGAAWLADSRGIEADYPWNNPGPISAHTLRALKDLDVPLTTSQREPKQLTETDLQRVDHIVAVKEGEHRPMLDRRFPGWSSRVEFWNVDDVDFSPPHLSLAQLEIEVDSLLERLAMR